MARTQNKVKTVHYDYVVLGNNFIGKGIALHLHGLGFNVALVEERAHIGLTLHSLNANASYREYFSLLPQAVQSQTLIEALNKHFDLQLTYQILPHKLMTFSQGELIPFVGFGDKNFESMDLLNEWTQENILSMDSPIEFIFANYAQALEKVLIPQAEITEIEIDNEHIQSVIINGAQRLVAPEYISCVRPRYLFEFINEDHKKLKSVKQKVAKAKSWHCVSLSIHHEQNINNDVNNYYLLMGHKTDYEPVLGQFFNGVNGKQQSFWQSMAPSDRCEEEEYLGNSIKSIKKLIKKAWPEAFASNYKETISVYEDACGFVDMGLTQDSKVPGLNNLTMASGLAYNHPGLIADMTALTKYLARSQSAEATESEGLV